MSPGPMPAVSTRSPHPRLAPRLQPPRARHEPSVASKAKPASPSALTDTIEAPPSRVPGIHVNNTWHPTRTAGDIMPGDIGFYYRSKNRNFKQGAISWGEGLINITQPGHKGDPSVLHAYVVLQSYPLTNRLLVADAAGGPDGSVGCDTLFLDFTGREKDPFDVDAYHLYYRFKDSRLRERVVKRAQAWTMHRVANFSMTNAMSAPFRVKSLLPLGRRGIRHLLKHSPFAGPVPAMSPGIFGGHKFHKVMCSEFVACVYIPEVLQLFCEDHHVGNLGSGLKMGGLKSGPAGEVFDCDPRYLVPSSLQGRLARSPDVALIGCIPPAFITR